MSRSFMSRAIIPAFPLLVLALTPGRSVPNPRRGRTSGLSGSRRTVRPWTSNSAVRVTDRPGYDNQPHFPPGERMILFTAIDSLGQADIWSFDLRSGNRPTSPGRPRK